MTIEYFCWWVNCQDTYPFEQSIKWKNCWENWIWLYYNIFNKKIVEIFFPEDCDLCDYKKECELNIVKNYIKKEKINARPVLSYTKNNYKKIEEKKEREKLKASE